jgi:hypothetical protein
MAGISQTRMDSAHKAASNANNLGALVYAIAKIFMWILSVGVFIGLIAVYQANEYNGLYTDWETIWPLWGALVGTWLVYAFLLMMIMLFGAQVQTQAESLEIQLAQARDLTLSNPGTNNNPNR